jgi:hypothetical protein
VLRKILTYSANRSTDGSVDISHTAPIGNSMLTW